MASPLLGAEGNAEFLVHLLAGAPPVDHAARLLDAAVADAAVTASRPAAAEAG